MIHKYPDLYDMKTQIQLMEEYARLKHEYGAKDVGPLWDELQDSLNKAFDRLKALPEDNSLAKKEPDDLEGILALRPQGPRKMWDTFQSDVYDKKLKGALIGRLAGCTLGAIVEFWSVENMEKWARHSGDAFPPTDYWSQAKSPSQLRYQFSRCEEYTKDKMDGVPVDDDIAYTQLGLLIAEKYGPHFTTKNVGQAWLDLLPYACTAEDVALKNLKKGLSADKAGEVDNPYCQWIGADIRSDPWGYIAPGYPEKAAAMAYQDAYLSHRRNGIYGEMFFSACIAAAFAADNAIDALCIGLTEIPAECTLSHDIKWALDTYQDIHNYMDAKQAVDERFCGMSGVHTNLNACLTVFGLTIGGDDFTKVISETVAMGYDNDCTAATAGSIIGAIIGIDNIPFHWYKNFNNKTYSYLNGHELFYIDDLEARFKAQAEKVFV